MTAADRKVLIVWCLNAAKDAGRGAFNVNHCQNLFGDCAIALAEADAEIERLEAVAEAVRQWLDTIAKAHVIHKTENNTIPVMLIDRGTNTNISADALDKLVDCVNALDDARRKGKRP